MAVRHKLIMVISVTAALAFAWVGISQLFGSDNTFPTTRALTPQRTRPPASLSVTPTATPTVPHPAKVDQADPDSRFEALVSGWTQSNTAVMNDPKKMITAAGQVCAMVSAGQSLSHASAALRAGYDLTGKQAAAVGAAAVEVYCPQNKV